jgi:hypothetical protein
VIALLGDKPGKGKQLVEQDTSDTSSLTYQWREQLWEKKEAYINFLSGEAGAAAPATPAERAALQEREQFVRSGVDLASAVYARHLQSDNRFAYYYLAVPLTVFPPPGTYIAAVEVELHFNPGSADERPFVRDIFPKQEFQDEVKLEGGLTVGISDALQFAWVVVSGTAQVTLPFVDTLLKVLPDNQLTIQPSDYAFLMRKPLTMTSIRGSDIAFWRFNGRDRFEQPEPLQFGVIFGVPLAIRTVRVAKTLRARRRNQSLKTRLAHDLERIQKGYALLQRVFQQNELDQVIDDLKQALRNEWNVVQDDLPLWNLEPDMVH